MDSKVVILGDGGVGKTTWVKVCRGLEFEKRYINTLGVEVTPLECQYCLFSIWDTAGQEKFCGLKEGYYLLAKIGIIFYDVTNRISYNNVGMWVESFRKVCPNAPIIIVGTKMDVENKKITEKEHEALKKFTPHLFRISSKHKNQAIEPLIAARKILYG